MQRLCNIHLFITSRIPSGFPDICTILVEPSDAVLTLIHHYKTSTSTPCIGSKLALKSLIAAIVSTSSQFYAFYQRVYGLREKMGRSIHQVSMAILVAASLSHSHWTGQCDLLKHTPLQILPMIGTGYEFPMLYPPKTEGNSSTPQFHLYALEEFAGGRGISILTTPERIEAFGNLPSLAPDPNESWSTIYEEREIPGKGRGLIAKKTLHRGDTIFSNTPILLLDDDLPDRPKWSRAAVGGLPVPTQKLFWELCRPDGSDLVMGRIDVNVFDVEIGGTSFAALFPEIAVSQVERPTMRKLTNNPFSE